MNEQEKAQDPTEEIRSLGSREANAKFHTGQRTCERIRSGGEW